MPESVEKEGRCSRHDRIGTNEDDEIDYIISPVSLSYKPMSTQSTQPTARLPVNRNICRADNCQAEDKIPDCGATIIILPERYVKDHNLKLTSKRLRMWNNSEITLLGTTRTITRNPRNNNRYSIEFVVVRENLVPIIGARASKHMNIVIIHHEGFISVSPPRLTETQAPRAPLTALSR